MKDKKHNSYIYYTEGERIYINDRGRERKLSLVGDKGEDSLTMFTLGYGMMKSM